MATRNYAGPVLKPGDLVRVRSGGPVMTVQALGADRFIRCAWVQDGGPMSDTFGRAALEKVDPEAAAEPPRGIV